MREMRPALDGELGRAMNDAPQIQKPICRHCARLSGSLRVLRYAAQVATNSAMVLCQGFWYKLSRLRFGPHGGRVDWRCRLPLQRDQVALVVLSLADGAPFTPAQIQKSVFLASDKVPGAFDRFSRYDFQPYDYGPFDRRVYSDVEELERRGLAQINQQPGTRWRTYAATQRGVTEGRRLARQLSEDQRTLLTRIVQLVRGLSFNDLISAIYRAYPGMRARSVFRD
jgi:hypothetical protein